jgi:hypothetical protein
MLAAMHPSQMYALSQMRMAEDQAQARHDRMVADGAPAPLWHVLRARLRRTRAPLATPAARAVAAKPAR